MGAVLPDHLVISGAEFILGDRVGLAGLGIGGRREFGLAEAGPDRRLRAEGVGEIDEFFGGDDAIGALEVGFGPRRRGRAATKRIAMP